MKVSRQWLQFYFEAPLPQADVLAEALTFHAFEIESVEKAGDDDILDVKITPNRGHDCLSHRGIAGELSAILNLPLARDPFAIVPDLSLKTAAIDITVHEPTLCPRYIAGLIEGVKVGPSPEWLKKSLEALGQRSINNVVDATNYVMFNLGQPLHAFDAGKLSKKAGAYKLGVRRARADEELKALDGKTYPLSYQTLVITDEDRGIAIGLAGVKGGEPAAITEATTSIIIESANFDGPTVRRAAAALRLRTDASARFEQGLSPELAGWGMRAVADLITHIAGGTIAGFVDFYPAPQKMSPVSVTLAQVQATLGHAITDTDVAQAFQRLGFQYTVQESAYVVAPPWARLDLLIAEDLIEEVARVTGYDRIPEKPLPPFAERPEVNANFFAAEQAREELRLKGYSEVYTSVFSQKGERAVANKIGGEKPFLRASLLPGLREAVEMNKQNKDLLGLKEVKVFEIGTVWQGGKEELMAATAGEKEEAQEAPLASFGKPADAWAQYPSYVPPLVQYKPFSRYPSIVRDVAVWLPGEMTEADTLSLISAEAGPLAARIGLFDRFEKAGKVSLAYRIVFQSPERTLTEAEANAIMERVYAALKAKGYEIR